MDATRPTGIMRTTATVVASLLFGGAVLAGCSGAETDATDPGQDATTLLDRAADAMAGLATVRIDVEADDSVADLPVRRVHAQVTSDGDAAGTAALEQFGQLLEVDFVVAGEEFHYRLLGSWQQGTRADAAAIYDPSAILDPDRGIAHLLRTATEASVVDGPHGAEAAYRVRARFDPAAVAVLLPGVPAPITGEVRLTDDPPRVQHIVFDLPDQGPVTVQWSDFDAAADIRVP